MYQLLALRIPHLDFGDFAQRPHRKHFCANCGRDSTWSSTAMISTPLKPLHDQFNQASSTLAIIWTADRPQEKGIHVHIHDGQRRIVDDTFSEFCLKEDGYRSQRYCNK